MLSDSKVTASKAQTTIRSELGERQAWYAAAERDGMSVNAWCVAALDRAAGVRALELEVSEALDARLRERAEVSGVSISSLICVLLDQALVLYPFAAPASSADELAGQLGKVVESVAEAGLATRVVAEAAGAVSADQAAPAEASGGKASPARRSSKDDACPGNPGRGVRCKLCGKTH